MRHTCSREKGLIMRHEAERSEAECLMIWQKTVAN